MIGTSRTDLTHLLLAGSAALAVLLAFTLSRGAVPLWTAGFAWLIAALITIATATSISRSSREERFRQGLTSALTHHLRTSLAHIRAYDEMLLLGRDSSDAERRAWLEIIGREAEALGTGVENVLYILAGDDDPSYPVRRTVDLSALLEDVACGWRNSDGTPIDCMGPLSEILVEGDEGALRHAINNLFDVVTRAGGPQRQIRATLGIEAAGRVQGRVRLEHPGSDPATTAAAAEGTDFSLETIVAERIFRAHGGELRRWESSGECGFRFELPLSTPTLPSTGRTQTGSSV